MRATTLFNLQRNNVARCKLQQFVARITSQNRSILVQRFSLKLWKKTIRFDPIFKLHM